MHFERNRGFTLIELLIVIFIIGIIISVAMIIPGSRYADRQIKEESKRLAYLFNMASEKAVLSNLETGFLLDGNQYEWWERNREKNTWELLEGGSWRRHSIPDDIMLTLTKPALDNNRQNSREPDLVFYTDGTMTPMQIILSYRDKRDYRETLESQGVAIFADK